MLLPSMTLDELTAWAVDEPLKTEVLSVAIVSPSSSSSSPPPPTKAAPRRPLHRPTQRALTRDEARRRRLDRERLRTQGVKHRIEQLRRDLAALTITREEAIRRREQHPRHVPEFLRRYLELVRSSEQLYGLQLAQEAALQRHLVETTAVELLAESGYRFRVATPRDTTAAVVRRVSDGAAGGGGQLFMDPITLFESLVRAEPLTPREAETFVGESCREMTHSLAQSDWMSSSKEFDDELRVGRRIAGTLLEFRLAKQLRNVTPLELMEKTWTLLTKLDEYQRIQPQTTQLRVLQRVSADSWVVGLAVGTRYTLTLVGRAAVPGGYVVTFRSLPLVRNEDAGASEAAFARQRFLESETGGLFVNTFSWYKFTAAAATDCDVVFGGTARNIHPEYLKQLQLEVVAGFARWQAAVGFPHVLFAAPLQKTAEPSSTASAAHSHA